MFFRISKSIVIVGLFLISVVLLGVQTDTALAQGAVEGQDIVDPQNANLVNPMPPLESKVMRLTNSGFVPKSVKIDRQGSLVFFYNDTGNTDIDIEVDYGSRKTYCSTGKFKLSEDGIARPIEPVTPRSFATVCFPDSGNYKVRARTAKTGALRAQGTIYVQKGYAQPETSK